MVEVLSHGGREDTFHVREMRKRLGHEPMTHKRL